MEKPRQDWLTYTSKNWNRQNVLSVGGNPASYWHWLLHLWVTSTKLHQKGHIRGGIAEQFNFRNAFLPHGFLSKSIHQQQLVCWVSPREKFQLFLPLLIFSDSSGIPIRQDWNFRTYKIATSLKLTGSILQKIDWKTIPFLVEGHVFAGYWCYSSFVGYTRFIHCIVSVFPVSDVGIQTTMT